MLELTGTQRHGAARRMVSRTGQCRCVPASNELLYGISPPEAAMVILLQDGQELRETGHLRDGLVKVPLQVGTPPIDPPQVLCSNERGLRHRAFDLLRRAIPTRPYFEDLDALPGEPVCEIDFVANVRGAACAAR